MAGLPATFIGAADIPHCSGMVRAEGSPNVFLNGIPWSCLGHLNIPHLAFAPGDCVIHTMPICTGSETVMINGIPAGRVGDAILDCTFVAEGSPNIFA